MKRFWIYVTTCLFMFLSPPDGHADTAQLNGPVTAQVIDIYDGDTFTVEAHIWINQTLKTKVRLLGVDTPEIRSKCSHEKELAKQARHMIRQLIMDQPVILSGIRKDKYGGRVLANATTADGTDLATLLIRHGLGRPYDGGKRIS